MTNKQCSHMFRKNGECLSCFVGVGGMTNKQWEKEFDEKFFIPSEYAYDKYNPMSIPAKIEIKQYGQFLLNKHLEELEYDVRELQIKTITDTGSYKYNFAYDEVLGIIKSMKGN